MHFNMACQVDKKKTCQQFKEKNVMNSEVIDFLFTLKGMHSLSNIPHQRGINYLNMACQVNKKKNLSAIPKKKLMNSEGVFHEILLLQGTTATGLLLKVEKSYRQGTSFGEQLKVQKSVHTQTFSHPTPQCLLTTIPVDQNKIQLSTTTAPHN